MLPFPGLLLFFNNFFCGKLLFKRLFRNYEALCNPASEKKLNNFDQLIISCTERKIGRSIYLRRAKKPKMKDKQLTDGLNIGLKAFAQWKQRKKEKELKHDAGVVMFLLDR